ncbi:uncharacterized protein [Leishmania mexicana MHOM/GT/2001/U1103]|uniref:Uncharacterized protein n=1 Tax=Leishmania mexicana (strain MHOM/GT/2001/U1103) TaxID=929439 RepID=E9AK28_LEIMU|nr:uncharacterized protein [Leishmania mexicana MHOM/GT/2001/U1103]CBZ23278.1 unnamed protein product [Leishmania mexicana MHOM/GT/2001/U1103]
MPFSNVSAEEARALCEFAERRQVSCATMASVGSSTVPTESESGADIDTHFLDAVVGVVEAVLMRYALTCLCDTATTENGKRNQLNVSASGGAPTLERLYPFPSLFLHTPRAFVHLHRRHSHASGCSPSPVSEGVDAEREGPCADDALAPGNVYCTPGMPPTPLLYKNASVGTASHATTHEEAAVHSATDGQMQPAPLPYDSLARFPPQLHRNTSAVLHNPVLDSARRMVNVSLTPEPIRRPKLAAASDKSSPPSTSSSVQEMVQVVLQAEAAVVVTTAVSSSDGPSAATWFSTDPRSASVTDTRSCRVAEERMLKPAAPDTAALSEAPLLFSPDATSCVLVACRVALHEGWQSLIASSAAGASRFAGACGRTAAAAMAHLDREDGVAEMLHQLVWDSAVPAVLHAVHQHYATCMNATSVRGSHESSDDTASCTASVMTLKDMLARLWCAVAPPADPASTPPPPLLQVDWYVVGATRMRKSAAPVLANVFRQFFAASPVTTPTNPHLLAEEVHLNKSRPQITSVATATTACTVNVAHRLREDGVCFWSFNTTLQPWCVEPDGRRRYAYPMTWGLLLSVATGHSWPATVHPGTRACPLREIRSLSVENGYQWVTPLSSDALHGTRRASTDFGRAGGLQLACNVVPSTTVAQRVNKSAASTPPSLRLWSALDALPAPSSGAERDGDGVSRQETTTQTTKSVTATVTLASYVRTLLSRQEAWWARVRRCQMAPSEAGSLPTQVPLTALSAHKRVLPLLLRRRTSFARPSPARRHQHDDEEDGRDNDDDGGRGSLVHWSSVDAAVVRTLLSRPRESLLQGSTTPHCEPPDFCDHARDGLLWRASVRPADIFVEGTDGLYIE